MPDRLPSQRDVAQLAGVSRTTVSYVLNGDDRTSIPQVTRERVLSAAEELGFRPNQMARGLRGRHSHVIGLLTDDIATTPYAVRIIKGAQDAAFAAGRTLLIIDTHGAGEAAREALAMFAAWRVDGVIFATDFHREAEPPDAIRNMPAVLVDCYAPGRHLPSIVPDEVQGGRLATETLIAAGHRRIGFIAGPGSFPASAGRLIGYREALEVAGIEFDPGLVRTGDWWQESGFRHTEDLLDQAVPPTALFCGNDWMAMGAYDALRELGRRIPQDVAVIGFDNREEIAAHMYPRLTTIALPYYEMGYEGVTQLISQIDTPAKSDQEALQIRLPCPLVRRESVGAEFKVPNAPAETSGVGQGRTPGSAIDRVEGGVGRC